MSWDHEAGDTSTYGRIAAKVELAQTYFDDGAPASAARCLREAAEISEIFAAWKNAELEKMIAEARHD